MILYVLKAFRSITIIIIVIIIIIIIILIQIMNAYYAQVSIKKMLMAPRHNNVNQDDTLYTLR